MFYFHEFHKYALNVDKQLAHLDRFHSQKLYHEWYNELLNIEGEIPILDQYLEFSSTTTTSFSFVSPL